MKTLRNAFFIVGTSIGAGFLSGAELVRFFRGKYFVLPVILSSAIFCGMCFLYLYLGRKYGGYEHAVKALFRRAAPVVKWGVFLLSFIPCAGMLAGLDALLPRLKPLLSIAGLFVAVFFVLRGTKGITIFNSVLVPVLLGFVFFSGGKIQTVSPVYSGTGRPFAGGIVYAGMNAFLAAPVLMDAGKDMKRILPPALLSAAAVAVCAVVILGKIYAAGAGAIRAEMPFLYVMRNAKLFSVMAAAAILTSLVSSLYPLLTACGALTGVKKYAAESVVLLAAFSLSRVGLTGIVNYFYPLLGGVGLLLSAVCILNDYLFEKHDEKVHTRGKHAKNKGRAHHKVKLKHLPAVNDKVSETRLRNDVLAHDRPDPSHADVDFQHGNE